MRTIGSRITVEGSQAKRELKDIGRGANGLVDELQKAAKSGDLTATAVAKIGPASQAALGMSEKAAARLEDQIAETAAEVRRLDKAFRETGDITLLRDMDKQFAKLKRQLKDRDRFGDAGEDAAIGFSARFAAKLGPLMARAPIGPAMGVPLAAAAAAAAPVVAGVLTAGIVGAIGVGAAGGGIAMAIADDPRIQAAGKRLGLTIRSSLSDAARPFRAETLAAIGDIGREFSALRPVIADIAEDSAKFVRPLTSGALGALRELGPSLATAVSKAGPVIDVISRKLPELGRTFGNQIEMIAGGSEEAAEALSQMFTVIQVGVSTVGPTIRTLTELFGALDKAGLATGFIGIAEDMGLFETNAKKMTGMNGEVVGALDKTGEAAAGAAAEIKTLAEQMRELADANRSAVDSEIAFESAIDEANAAAKTNGKTIDTNTAKGRANMQALSGLADATLKHADATRDATHSQDRVNGVMNRGYDRFMAAAKAMGVAKGEANRLARELGLIPSSKTISIRYPTMSAAEIKARALARAINSIDTYKEILIIQRLQTKGVRVSGVTGRGGFEERWGGIHEHAQMGLLRDAQIASPASPARYAWAEPATGGEAFIPKYGNLARSRSIWAEVGQRWLGMRPSTSISNGPTTYNLTVNGANQSPHRIGREMVRQIEEMTARRADLMERTG